MHLLLAVNMILNQYKNIELSMHYHYKAFHLNWALNCVRAMKSRQIVLSNLLTVSVSQKFHHSVSGDYKFDTKVSYKKSKICWVLKVIGVKPWGMEFWFEEPLNFSKAASASEAKKLKYGIILFYNV